jgi:hypothetical protein
VSQSPFIKDVSTEAEESPLLGAVTKQRPMKTVTDLSHNVCCSYL